ncbi:hypothetical protein EH165_06370 [Nakamurella antarctica]|uniref:DUF3558 domain-containing protein n=1 Tax=Nakamurella antarctica TaxID=1902245 RepID=A0A3G8ZW00_9ACTN|nr:hypothetical protein [Nakamurella antarctica]AZI57831.1 hypothetical protein EH165_06370 [Nakamurella antarctica]
MTVALSVVLVSGCGPDQGSAISTLAAPAVSSGAPAVDSPSPADAPESGQPGEPISGAASSEPSPETGGSAAAEGAAAEGPAAEEPAAEDPAPEAVSEFCALFSGEEISKILGAGDFQSAKDVSVSGPSCVYGNPMYLYTVLTSTEDVSSYYEGDLEGLSPADARARLASDMSIVLQDPVISSGTVGDSESVLIVEPPSIVGPSGTAGVVADGRVMQVSVTGTELGADGTTLSQKANEILVMLRDRLK